MLPRADLSISPVGRAEALGSLESTADPRQQAFQRSMAGLLGQSLQGDVLSKLTDGSYLVKVAGASARMLLPPGAQVGTQVPLTLVALSPRPTFQIGSPAGQAPLAYSEAGPAQLPGPPGSAGRAAPLVYMEGGPPPAATSQPPAAQPGLAGLPGRAPVPGRAASPDAPPGPIAAPADAQADAAANPMLPPRTASAPAGTTAGALPARPGQSGAALPDAAPPLPGTRAPAAPASQAAPAALPPLPPALPAGQNAAPAPAAALASQAPAAAAPDGEMAVPPGAPGLAPAARPIAPNPQAAPAPASQAPMANAAPAVPATATPPAPAASGQAAQSPAATPIPPAPGAAPAAAIPVPGTGPGPGAGTGAGTAPPVVPAPPASAAAPPPAAAPAPAAPGRAGVPASPASPAAGQLPAATLPAAGQPDTAAPVPEQAARAPAPAGAESPRTTSHAAALLSKAPLIPASQLPPIDPKSTPATLSEAARVITSVLTVARNAPPAPSAILATAPLVASPGAPPEAIEAALRKAVAHSGLFYESHVAEWSAGKRPLADLLQEPQMQRPAATGAEAQPARQGVPADPATAQFINLQLQTQEHARLAWQGQLWPGQDLQWEVQRDAPERQHGGEAAPEPTWRSALRLRFELLGNIGASVVMVGEQIHIQLDAGSSEVGALLREHAGKLDAAMEASGNPLSSLNIRAGRGGRDV